MFCYINLQDSVVCKIQKWTFRIPKQQIQLNPEITNIWPVPVSRGKEIAVLDHVQGQGSIQTVALIALHERTIPAATGCHHTPLYIIVVSNSSATVISISILVVPRSCVCSWCLEHIEGTWFCNHPYVFCTPNLLRPGTRGLGILQVAFYMNHP